MTKEMGLGFDSWRTYWHCIGSASFGLGGIWSTGQTMSPKLRGEIDGIIIALGWHRVYHYDRLSSRWMVEYGLYIERPVHGAHESYIRVIVRFSYSVTPLWRL